MINSPDDLYKIELHSRGSINSTTYVDLIVLDPKRSNVFDIYLLNTINTETQQNLFAMQMDDIKTGSLYRAEGPRHVHGEHRPLNVYTPDKKFYDTHETKVDDFKNILYVAKCLNPDNTERRQKEQKAIEALKLNIQSEPDSHLILAWDGDIRSEIFKILDTTYNTPMLEEWKDEIVNACIDANFFQELTVLSFGKEYKLKAGLLKIFEYQLEEIITEGINNYTMPFALMNNGPTTHEAVLPSCTTLDVYLENFASALGQRIQENSELRFDPRIHKHHESLYDANLHANEQGNTGLFPPQADVVMGCAKTLEDPDEDYIFLVGEMGSGKSPMGATIPYVTHALRSKSRVPKPFRTLVFVPSIMVDKWKREIKERVPNAKVYQIDHYTDIAKLEKMPFRPTEIEYYVMSSEAAKQTYPLSPIADYRVGMKDDVDQLERAIAREEKPKIRLVMNQYGKPKLGPSAMYCPRCGNPLKKTKDKFSDQHFFEVKRGGSWLPNMTGDNYSCSNIVSPDHLPKSDVPFKDGRDQKCGYVLWRPKLLKPSSLERKVSPAWYINKRLRRGFFEYLIADEVHEYKSGDSDRANAFGQLINHTNKQILLTGTLLGGMASDIFYLFARLDANKLKLESIKYTNEELFVKRYGVYETTITTNPDGIGTKKKRKKVPGVSPQVFPRFLMSNCAFIELSDLGYALPPYKEIPIFVPMEEEHRIAYNDLEEAVSNAIENATGGASMKHLSTYVNKLYQYADSPFKHDPITYFDEETMEMETLFEPRNFPEDFVPNKYLSLTNLLDEQIDERKRKVLVYTRFTGDKSGQAIDTWLYDRLKSQGYNVGILRSSGSYDGIKMPKQEGREAWLKKQMEKNDWDVLVTNSRLVAVGLDLLMFPHICFYQMDYSSYNYMQASRRSWRIKQTEEVEVSSLVYANTIQVDVLEIIAKKIDAAMALQGKFSEEGLRAMVDSGSGINALAKKLMSEGRLDDINSIEDRWKRINASYEQMQNSVYEGYDGYEMNPLGIDRIREIQSGVITQMKEDVTAGKVSKADLEKYLEHLSDMFTEVENVIEYNKTVKKNQRIVEGQSEFVF